VDLTPLSVPFSEIEIHKALKSIPRDKSPDPYGFGSAFYHDFWSIIKTDIINTFSQFYNNQAQLDRNIGPTLFLSRKRTIVVLPRPTVLYLS
jgi:hypothetical protein